MNAPDSNSVSLDLFALPADERYAYFIREAIARDGVWALQGPGGFVAFRDEDERDCFPFWPSPELAAAVANDDWADCRPEPLELEVFMERWLKGMARDERLASVFPAPDGTGIVVEPLELYEDLSQLKAP
ncbi:DUF2750 domain-containing protein [Allochromatium vinosum]|uniref:DUF2750 domain-containing protein n=1 Tax=Allochromatium vinosum (strain ATCC 17899 / DSM 180 / NBRC 103801 / NCIMB 10441 / D) TaxID=572477 RepID=D3RTP8_ALLVD|nr:DUF2750 domain-containing protein [Allochromatium vinosum]ADC62557.1 conserved hypothetical protein [Allochromatium vinosum DSM 180]